MLDIHPDACVSPLADIEDSVKGSHIFIDANTLIDAFVKIKPAGGSGDIFIGSECVINSGCVLYSGNGIHIGHGVAIASNCTLAPVNHEFKSKELTIREQGFRPSKGGIIIEDDVWIGANSIILDGAILRKGCVIGAGSMVRDEMMSYSIYAGNPARLIGVRE